MFSEDAMIFSKNEDLAMRFSSWKLSLNIRKVFFFQETHKLDGSKFSLFWEKKNKNSIGYPHNLVSSAPIPFDRYEMTGLGVYCLQFFYETEISDAFSDLWGVLNCSQEFSLWKNVWTVGEQILLIHEQNWKPLVVRGRGYDFPWNEGLPMHWRTWKVS